jgi:glycosyltransferase involved in cell wall biosynthesis
VPFISVIVPVYKVEPYLRRCIDSILAQTFTNFECILIDDGSPDACPIICDEYAEKDERIRVIHQENKGTAFARDAGIQDAKSEFLVFVDSDDWLEPSSLELLYNKQCEENADIVIGGVKEIFPFGHRYIFPEKIISEDLLVYYFSSVFCKSLWAKIFKKSLFANYYVPTAIIGEDIVTSVQIFAKTNIMRIKLVNSIIYNYDRRTNGITLRKRQQYRTPLEDPRIACEVWIKNYVDTLHASIEAKSALLCNVIVDAINPYLRFNSTIKKEDISYFYREYYKKCFSLKSINIFHRIIIPIHQFSFSLGKVYLAVMNNIMKMKIFFKRCFIADNLK